MLKRFFALASVVLVGFMSSGCGLISSPARAVPAEYVELPTVTPAAAALVGQYEAEQAAHEMTAFTLATAFNPALLDPAQQSFTSDELNSPLIQEVLAPGALPLWNALVDEASAGNRDAQEEVKGLQIFALDQPTWQLNPDRKILHSQSITNVVVDVLAADGAVQPAAAGPSTEGANASELAGDAEQTGAAEAETAEVAATPRLKVTFAHVARLRFVEDKYPFEVVFTRNVQYNLVPSGSAAGERTPNKITQVTATPVIPARPGSTATGAKPSSANSTSANPTSARPSVANPTTAKPSTAKPSTAAPSTRTPRPSSSKTTTAPQPSSTTTSAPQPSNTTTSAPATSEPSSEAPAADPPAADPPAADPPAADPPAADPQPSAAAPLPPAAVAALIAPLEVSSDPGASADPSSSAVSGRLWQISAFFGPFTVDTVALPR